MCTKNEKRNVFLKKWKGFEQRFPQIAQFLLFFLVCNGVTVLQLILLPLFKGLLGRSGLIHVGFQFLQVGTNLNGTPYYVFDYAAGTIDSGGGGGLAYFLAVEMAMGIAQVINFISQRKVTFQAKGNVWRAAAWYVLAYLVITIGAAALQGLYKVPVYTFFQNHFGTGTGGILGDVVTMLINCTISFWVFFPIMKWIFRK